MLPYQERVIQEYDALQEKTSALYTFLESEPFAKLNEEDQELLHAQYGIMLAYCRILRIRISKF